VNIVIVGASRGIGLEFAKQFAASENNKVHATVRDLNNPGSITTLPGNIILHKLDVRFKDQRSAFIEKFDAMNVPIDYFIYNAGIIQRDASSIDEIFEVNSRAPIILANAFVSLVKKSQMRTIMLMGGAWGSRKLSEQYGWNFGAYQESKQRLNDLFRFLSPQWYGVIAIVMSPGAVRTDMNTSERAKLTPEQSVMGMREVINSLKPEDHGKFFNWRREELPW
jgi:NAD(P)-dependent dehydrogenase (short-subunit alcohol dehydrogenase family)